MTALNSNSFSFVAEVASVIKDFNNNPNVEVESFEVNEYCETIKVTAYLSDDDTAREDFFGFFYNIGYEVNEINGYTNDDYYNTEEYPNGAIVIPEFVTLEFFEGVKEVVYRLEDWDIKAR